MRIELTVFRAFLIIGTIVVAAVTYHAIAKMGSDVAGDIFFGDMTHPWRGQFNIDFGFHLLLAASWMIYRARSLPLGILWGVLAILMGALFTFPFILVATVRARGNMRIMLLGRHAGSGQ